MSRLFSSLPFPRLVLLSAVLLLASCAAGTGGPVTQQRAVDIARKTTIKRERWPKGLQQQQPNLVEVLVCKAAPLKDGTWAVAVHQGVMKKDSGKTVLVPGSKRIISLSKTGQIKGYRAAAD